MQWELVFFFISPASKVMQVYILSKLCQTGQVNQSTRNHCCPSDSSMQDRRQSKKTCLGTKYVHTAAVKVAKCLQPKEGGRKEGRFLWSQTRHYSFDWMDCLSFIWSPVHFLMKLFKIVETQATHRGQCNNDIADFILKWISVLSTMSLIKHKLSSASVGLFHCRHVVAGKAQVYLITTN